MQNGEAVTQKKIPEVIYECLEIEISNLCDRFIAFLTEWLSYKHPYVFITLIRSVSHYLLATFNAESIFQLKINKPAYVHYIRLPKHDKSFTTSAACITFLKWTHRFKFRTSTQLLYWSIVSVPNTESKNIQYML